MSSANRVSLKFVEETAFAVTPLGTNDFGGAITTAAGTDVIPAVVGLTGTTLVPGGTSVDLDVDVDGGGAVSFTFASVEDLSVADYVVALAAFLDLNSGADVTANILDVEVLSPTAGTGTITISAFAFVAPTGDMTEIKFISESLTGTPDTVESQEIRSDRQTSGTVNTGLTVGGTYEFELSGDESIKHFIKQAMSSNVTPASTTVADLTIDTAFGTITTTNDFVAAGFANGDFIVLTGFVNVENNTVVLISNVTTTVLNFVGDGTEIDEAAVGAIAQVPAFHDIGIEEFSDTISKEFLDVNVPNIKSITYAGMRTGEMVLNFAFGEIVNGGFTFGGAGYDLPAIPISTGRTIIAAGSDQPLDASNGFGFLTIDGQATDVCLESLSVTLNNNLDPQNCIGLLAPQDQIAGSAAVTFESSLFLGNTSFETFMPNKLDQTPISIAFYTRDFNNKGYAVQLHRVQLSFPDPAAGGRDEQVTIEAAGTASFDSVQSNTMRVYFLV